LRHCKKSLSAIENALHLARQLGHKRLQVACHNGLGNINFSIGNHDNAIVKYKKAIELDPEYASPYTGLGNVYRYLGRYDKAISAYLSYINTSCRS
jgi:tetratricopeptide (TPR) repeat protein